MKHTILLIICGIAIAEATTTLVTLPKWFWLPSAWFGVIAVLAFLGIVARK